MGIQGKKCLFLVQGEGRGHMTQAISMRQILERAGMEICEVIIGKSRHRQIPDFFYEKIKVPVTTIESPNMAIDKKAKSMKPYQTFLKNLYAVPEFYESIKIINNKVKEHNPDLIINFFEPLCGVYYALFRPKMPIISVAHHYLYNHPEFEMPKGKSVTKTGLKFYTWLTAIGTKKRLALSFYPFDDCIKHSIYVIPPLLRDEVSSHSTQRKNYLLVYLLNSGYMEEVIKWHKQNPATELHCFVDKKEIGDTNKYDDTLYFHSLNDKKFLDMMANAKGLISTAGFESVCEAMYMGKPVLMVPVENHYEQFCNSRDAAKAGAGIYDKSFDIDKLLNYIPVYNLDNESFKDWVKLSPYFILRHVHSVLYSGDNVRQLFPQMSLQKDSIVSI